MCTVSLSVPLVSRVVRRLRIGAFVAIALLAARSVAAQQPVSINPQRLGEIALELAPDLPSSLGIQPLGLTAILCSGQEGGVAESRIVVKNGGPSQDPPFALRVLHYTLNLDDTVVATVLPNRLAFVGAQAFESGCGAWTYEILLHPRAPQKESEILLEPAAPGASTGHFSTSITLYALFRFQSAKTRETVELSSTITIDFCGRWTTLPTLSHGMPLALLVEKRYLWDALPAIASGGCQGDIFCLGGHRLVLEATPATVDALNQ